MLCPGIGCALAMPLPMAMCNGLRKVILEDFGIYHFVGSGYQLRLLSVPFLSTVLNFSGPNALRVGWQVGVTMKESLLGSFFVS